MIKHVLFSLLLLVGLAQAQTSDPATRRAFADHLFDRAEYYRAITEYERFLFGPTDPAEVPRIQLQIARAYHEGKQPAEARQRAQQLILDWPESEEARLAPALVAATYRVEEQDNLAAMELDRFAMRQLETKEGQEAALLAGIHYLRARDVESAKDMLSQVPEGSPAKQSADYIMQQSEVFADLPSKSPVMAGLMSAVIPGAGQLYIGKKSDALIAFILNGALMYATYEAFDNGEHVTGALLGIIESGWYFGNVYNAMNGAHKVNRSCQEGFLRNLEVQFRPVVDGEHPGLSVGTLFTF